MALKKVTATEFQTRAGVYIEQSAKQPLIITKHNRPARVLVDYEEYTRLKAHDTRVAVHPSELSDVVKAQLEKGDLGDRDSGLDHLME